MKYTILNFLFTYMLIMSSIFISGGGDTEISKKFDKEYIKFLHWWKNILYIPRAFHASRYPSCQERIDKIFPKKDWYNVRIISEENNIIIDDLIQYDWLYIWWGNTYRLLYLIKKSWFKKIIQEFIKLNKPIYWWSAWAIILWKEINTTPDMNITKLNINETWWFNYFNNHSIFCHYEEKKDWEIQEYIKHYKVPVIALPEWTWIHKYNSIYKVAWINFATIFSVWWWKYNINIWDTIDL